LGRMPGLSQRELADFAGRSERWVWSLERGDGHATLDLNVARSIANGLRVDVEVVLGLSALPSEPDAGLHQGEPTALAALEIEPDDVPHPAEITEAVLRLRRSYSTTAPAELRRRIDVRLRQVRRLLAGQARQSRRRDLLE